MLLIIKKYIAFFHEYISVQLNVFEENTAAVRCYEKAGFVVRTIDKNVFSYKDEQWSRCNMAVSLPAESAKERDI